MMARRLVGTTLDLLAVAGAVGSAWVAAPILWRAGEYGPAGLTVLALCVLALRWFADAARRWE